MLRALPFFFPMIFASAASAATISGPTQITASTSIAPCGVSVCGNSVADINEIADGITSDTGPNFNGFAGDEGATGTIRLEFDQAYDLTSFTLSNDINIRAEGVETFRLDFFDIASSLISSTAVFNAPVGQFAGQTYNFSEVLGVKVADLVILSVLPDCCNDQPTDLSRIEIREVQFEGTATTPVPLPAGLPLLAAGLGALALQRRRQKNRG